MRPQEGGRGLVPPVMLNSYSQILQILHHYHFNNTNDQLTGCKGNCCKKCNSSNL